jgi:hypothetical protein
MTRTVRINRGRTLHDPAPRAGGTEHRINALRSIRSVLTLQGLLLLTVPNALRRFPLHASAEDHASNTGGPFPIRAPARRYFPRRGRLSTTIRWSTRNDRFPTTCSRAAS